MEEVSLSINGCRCPFLSGAGTWLFGGRGRAFPFTLFPEEKAEVGLLIIVAVAKKEFVQKISTGGQKDPYALVSRQLSLAAAISRGKCPRGFIKGFCL